MKYFEIQEKATEVSVRGKRRKRVKKKEICRIMKMSGREGRTHSVGEVGENEAKKKSGGRHQ